MRTLNQEYFEIITNFIDDYTEANGSCPSTYDISDGTGISHATVGRYLQYMKEHDMLQYSGHRNYVTAKRKKIAGDTISVPVIGKISCGEALLAEENIEEYVSLSSSLFGDGEYFILRARGVSMIDAGIDEGDMVVIQSQDHAREGQIVVALVGDDATLKRYYPEPENRRVRLHPENKALKDMYFKNVVIQGIAVKVIKDLI